MEVLTSKNRMSATTFCSLYFSENVITGLFNNHNGLAATQCSEDFLITYCYTLMLIVFCAFPLFTYFKDSIFWTLLCIFDNIQHIRLYTTHIFLHSFQTVHHLEGTSAVSDLWQPISTTWDPKGINLDTTTIR